MSTTNSDLGLALVPHEKPSLKRKHSEAMSPTPNDKKPKLILDVPPAEKEFEGLMIGGCEAADYACRAKWRVGLFNTAYRKKGGEQWAFFLNDIAYYALLILGQYCWVTRPISTVLIILDFSLAIVYYVGAFLLMGSSFASGSLRLKWLSNYVARVMADGAEEDLTTPHHEEGDDGGL